MWHNSQELLLEIHSAYHRLADGETDALTAHAEARLLNAATKVLAIQLEHAKLTKRLHELDDVLPAFGIYDGSSKKLAVASGRSARTQIQSSSGNKIQTEDMKA